MRSISSVSNPTRLQVKKYLVASLPLRVTDQEELDKWSRLWAVHKMKEKQG